MTKLTKPIAFLSWGLATLLLLAAIAIIVFTLKIFVFYHSKIIPADGPLVYELPRGGSAHRMASDFYHRGLLSDPDKFVWAARLSDTAHLLQAGEYEFPPNATVKQVLQKVAKGDVRDYKFTIVEGVTYQQILAELRQTDKLQQQLADKTVPQTLAAVGITEHSNAEGLLYPDTYIFNKGDTDIGLLQQAKQSMDAVIKAAWQTRAEGLPYQSPYDVLIAASLIEKESAVADERPFIASVLVNRLQANMPLQFDPTVIYGLGEAYTGKLTKADMRKDTPYNTYRHRGLPPTPIAMPSKEAINAAVHPAETEYLYFVAKGDGSHVFSTNLQEHDKALRAYIEYLRTVKQQAKEPQHD